MAAGAGAVQREPQPSYSAGQGYTMMGNGGDFNAALARYQNQQLANLSALSTPPTSVTATGSVPVQPVQTPATLPRTR